MPTRVAARVGSTFTVGAGDKVILFSFFSAEGRGLYFQVFGVFISLVISLRRFRFNRGNAGFLPFP